MKVENVYQDSEGNWHIDYDASHLMGLAIRVYCGQFLLALFLLVPIMILAALVGFTYGKSLPEENTSLFCDFQPKPVCHEKRSQINIMPEVNFAKR